MAQTLECLACRAQVAVALEDGRLSGQCVCGVTMVADPAVPFESHGHWQHEVFRLEWHRGRFAKVWCRIWVETWSCTSPPMPLRALQLRTIETVRSWGKRTVPLDDDEPSPREERRARQALRQ